MLKCSTFFVFDYELIQKSYQYTFSSGNASLVYSALHTVDVQYWTEEVSHVWVINVTPEVSGRGIFDNI